MNKTLITNYRKDVFSVWHVANNQTKLCFQSKKSGWNLPIKYVIFYHKHPSTIKQLLGLLGLPAAEAAQRTSARVAFLTYFSGGLTGNLAV
jgi:hypothetical protein